MSTISARLGFAPASKVVSEPARPGLKRLPPIEIDVYKDPEGAFATLDYQQVPIHDLAGKDAPALDLWQKGFDLIDISHIGDLVAELNEVRRSNHLSARAVSMLRRKLLGRALRLSNGKTLRLLYVAPDGLIMRLGGPNCLRVNADEAITAHNGHFSAPVIHGDQDVYGTPVKQILKGLAPRLFRHKTPDGVNSTSPVVLVNVWLPLQQITQPLTLADRSTVNQPEQQLLHQERVDAFIERDEDMALNDIWMFLHDPQQQWYFHSELYTGKAYVFDTLGQAHGGCVISGEIEAEQYFLCLQNMRRALQAGDISELQHLADMDVLPLPADITAPLKAACEQMHRVINAARNQAIAELHTSQWDDQAKQAMDKVVRKSIELRAVGIVY